jgi:hypothetical protein
MVMINRDEELRQIDRFIDINGVKFGPTAFVSASIQSNLPERNFVHSDVKAKHRFWIKSKKKKLSR